jgi:hypothetical protein
MVLMGDAASQGQLITALAKAQKDFSALGKARLGQAGNQKFRYATLAQIMESCRPSLNEHGIFVSTPITSADAGEHSVSCALMGHGAQMWATIRFKAKDAASAMRGGATPIQAYGAATTYYRRYLLQALLGLEGDRDGDDGQEQPRQQRPPQQYTRHFQGTPADTPAAERRKASGISQAIKDRMQAEFVRLKVTQPKRMTDVMRAFCTATTWAAMTDADGSVLVAAMGSFASASALEQGLMERAAAAMLGGSEAK